MRLDEIFWHSVTEILGDDFYETIPIVLGMDIAKKIDEITAENLCEKCKSVIEAKLRDWLFEKRKDKEEFRNIREKLEKLQRKG